MPISGVVSSRPSLWRQPLRSASGIQAPCGITRHGPGEAGGAHLLPHEAAVHDHAARRFQQAPRHRHAFVIRARLPACARARRMRSAAAPPSYSHSRT